MCNQSKALGCSKHPAVPVKPQPIPPKAVNIVECSIATDSVVATATVRIDATMRRIVVDWGDGTVNTLRNRPGTEAAVGQQLPPGTYKLSHAYEAPENRNAFEKLVLIRVEDVSGGTDFCARTITLTPRYRVTRYRTRLTLESGCDSILEDRNEFHINLFIDGELVKTWQWKPHQSITPDGPFVLEGSLVSRELTLADRIVVVVLEIIEIDPLFDDVLSDSSFLSVHNVSGSISKTVSDWGFGCEVRIDYDNEVSLIVPLPSYGQTVVIKA
jgi:hypothetical protein